MADYNLKVITADTDGPSADTELLFGSPDQSSGTPKPYSFAGVKTWTRSWISLADVGLFETYVAGRYYLPIGYGVTSANAVPAANRIHFYPIAVPQTVTVSELFARIVTGGAGNWQGAIYAANASTLMPTGNVLTKSNASGSTTTGSTNVATALNANLQLVASQMYWLGVNVDNLTATFPSIAASVGFTAAHVIGDTTMSNVLAGAAAIYLAASNNQTLGTWPDMTALPTTPVFSINIPLVGFKVASVP